MSKHRRVKSLVREFDAEATTASPSTSTLNTRASSSSISSLASPSSTTTTATTTPLSPMTPDHPPSSINGRQGASGGTSDSSSSFLSSHAAAKQLDYGSQDSGHSKMSSGASSASNGMESMNGFHGEHAHGHGHDHHSSQNMLDDPNALENEERDDVFLPLSAPFNPGFSGGSSPRRDSTFGNYSLTGNTNNSRTRAAGPVPSTSSNGMTAAERREHSRRHSRVHSRNLSVFFPRPEQKGLPGYQPEVAETVPEESVTVDVPTAQTRGWGLGNGGNAFQKQQHRSLQQGDSDAKTQASSRRGHHHRHSMSHNFFPFLDTNGTQPQHSPRRVSGHSDQKLSPSSPTTPLNGVPKAVPSVSSTGSRHRHTPSDPSLVPSLSNLRTKYSHLPGPIRLLLAFAFHIPVLTQVAILASIGEVGLGASLWIAGQSGESLAVTGLGYLVVFDGLGALSSIMVEGNARGVRNLWDVLSPRRASENTVRYAYGDARSTTLSHFAQCVYLIFSAVYVCKESIEHVLLLHGPDEEGLDGLSGDASHGAAHGSFGHGEMMSTGGSNTSSGTAFEWEDLGVLIPTKLLVASMSACLFAAVALQNHASLTEAVGSQTYSLRPRRPNVSNKFRLSTSLHNAFLSNPFSLTVLTFSFALAAASLLIPAQQLAPLDKVVALLESIAMFYIAYPAAVATGRVLLQTAPTTIVDGTNSTSFRRAIEEIENHPSVVYLPPPHIWQLTPHPPPIVYDVSKPSSFGRKSIPPSYSNPSSSGSSSSSSGPPLTVVTLNVQVRTEATDSEILELTRWCREKCMLALVGNVSGQSKSAKAELTVQVVRFSESRALQAEGGHHSHAHGHDHGHSHDHGGGSACGGRSHDHGDHGGDSHGHNHEHGHGHQDEHDHQDHPSHSHSHDHHSSSHAGHGGHHH